MAMRLAEKETEEEQQQWKQQDDYDDDELINDGVFMVVGIKCCAAATASKGVNCQGLSYGKFFAFG